MTHLQITRLREGIPLMLRCVTLLILLSTALTTTTPFAVATSTSAPPTFFGPVPTNDIPIPFATVSEFEIGWRYDALSGYWLVTFGPSGVSSAARWAAVGFASEEMEGKGIIAHNTPAKCTLIDMYNFDITLLNDFVVPVVQSTNDNVTCAVPLSWVLDATRKEESSSASGFDIDNTTLYRAIFAQGPYVATSGKYREHNVFQAVKINPAVEALPPSDLGVVAWVVFLGTLAVWLLGGIIARLVLNGRETKKLVLLVSSKRQTVIAVIRWLGVLTVVLMPLAYAMLNARRAEDDSESLPFYRGMGHGAKVLMTLTILPILRHVSVFKYIFQTSFERVISPFHILIGVLLFAFTTVHGLGMTYENPKKAFKSQGDKEIPLYGTLSWLLMLLMIILGFLRANYYTPFRLMHWCYILVFAFAIVHHRALYLMLTPPLVLLALDYGFRIFSALRLGSTRILEADYDALSETTWLRIATPSRMRSSSKGASAGDYYCLIIPAVGSYLSHPFSVVSARGGEMVFAIQAAGKWTRALGALAASSPRGAVGSRVMVMGPYGGVSFPLDRVGMLMMVVGGSGVTPVFSTLESLVVGKGESACLRYPHLRGVHVLWVARHPTLLAKGAAVMEGLIRRCHAAGLEDITVTIHCTGGKQMEMGNLLSSPLPPPPPHPASLYCRIGQAATAGDNKASSGGHMQIESNRDDALQDEPLTEEVDASAPRHAFTAASAGPDEVQRAPSHFYPKYFSWFAGRPDVSQYFLTKHPLTAASRSHSAVAASAAPIALDTLAEKAKSTNENDRDGNVASLTVGVISCGPEMLLSQVKASVEEVNAKDGSDATMTTRLISHYEVFTI